MVLTGAGGQIDTTTGNGRLVFGMRRFVVLAVLLLLGVAPAAAVGLDQTVPGHPGLTYFELLRLVVTDLTPDGHGGDTFVPFRHIEGKDLTSDLPDTPAFDAVDVIAVPGDPARPCCSPISAAPMAASPM